MVTYRFLTAGSVEIEMMEKQASKKKLERLAIQGGDFRKAGARIGTGLTIAKLRQLLEDDVKNLNRMTSSTSSSSAHFDIDISDKELDFIMDREKIFSVLSGEAANGISLEGEMYDIIAVEQAASVLQSVN